MMERVYCCRRNVVTAKTNIYITNGRKMDVGYHKGDSLWFGHDRPEFIVPCDSIKPGDEVEIWEMMHGVGRVHGIGWPVHWLYTTREAIVALEEKTDRTQQVCSMRPNLRPNIPPATILLHYRIKHLFGQILFL